MTEQLPPLLVRIGAPIKVNGADRYIVAEKYRKGETIDGVKFWAFSQNFEMHALPYVETNITTGELVTSRLSRNAFDDVLDLAFGEGQRVPVVTFCEWHQYLKTADTDRWHFGRVEINGMLHAVRSDWVDDRFGYGWCVELYKMPYPDEWREGAVLVSRNLPVS